MAYAEASVLVERPISEVFQFIAEGENNKLWRPTVMDIQKMSEGAIGVGTVFEQGMRAPNGMRINADYELIEFNIDKKIAFKVLNGPYRAIGNFGFEVVDKGTKVTFSMNEVSELIDPARERHLQNVVGTITNLKECLAPIES